MRTYNRKRIEHQKIENVHQLCRLCLNTAEESVPIYNNDKDDICATLALRIMICVGFVVSRDDCLPNIVCTECHKELDRYYSFRKKCEVTYHKLNSHVQAVKGKQEIKPVLEKNQTNSNNLNIIKSEDNSIIIVKNDVDTIALDCNKNKKVDMVGTDESNLAVVNNVGHNVKDNSNIKETTHPKEELNFETFISTVLIQLGIIASVDNKKILLDHSVRTLEIETGDGKFLVELMEEDEEVEQLEGSNGKGLEESNLVKQNEQENNKSDVEGHLLQCEECGKQFVTRSVLARHVREHSGERPHTCRVCQRSFTQRAVMLRHELVHREQRPHQCLQCPKSFTQRGALAAHTRSHVPPHQRPLNLHRCPRCPKLFLYASGLSRHMTAHNRRVYACGVCARPFRDKSSLLRHMRNARHAAT